MTDNQYIFFIGGKDLEMETIKQLLSAHNQPYIDKNLGWGRQNFGLRSGNQPGRRRR